MLRVGKRVVVYTCNQKERQKERLQMTCQPVQNRAFQKEKDKQRERSIGRKEKDRNETEMGVAAWKRGRREGGEKGI